MSQMDTSLYTGAKFIEIQQGDIVSHGTNYYYITGRISSTGSILAKPLVYNPDTGFTISRNEIFLNDNLPRESLFDILEQNVLESSLNKIIYDSEAEEYSD